MSTGNRTSSLRDDSSHYLARLAANEVTALATSDELDLFGLFLVGQLYFDESDAKQATRFVPVGFDESLNSYFEAQRRGDQTVARPSLELPVRFGALLSMLEKAQPRNFVTACLDLLQYDGALYAQVDETISRVEAAYLQRGAWCQATLGNRENEELPIIVLTCCRIGSWQENRARTQIQAHTRRRFPGHHATVILWEPPMGANQCSVHLLPSPI